MRTCLRRRAAAAAAAPIRWAPIARRRNSSRCATCRAGAADGWPLFACRSRRRRRQHNNNKCRRQLFSSASFELPPATSLTQLDLVSRRAPRRRRATVSAAAPIGRRAALPKIIDPLARLVALFPKQVRKVKRRKWLATRAARRSRQAARLSRRPGELARRLRLAGLAGAARTSARVFRLLTLTGGELTSPDRLSALAPLSQRALRRSFGGSLARRRRSSRSRSSRTDSAQRVHLARPRLATGASSSLRSCLLWQPPERPAPRRAAAATSARRGSDSPPPRQGHWRRRRRFALSRAMRRVAATPAQPLMNRQK